MKTLKVILIGAGDRGRTYTDHMLAGGFKIVAAADRVPANLEYIKRVHGVGSDRCFDDWEALLDLPKLADIAVIATPDKLHYAPAVKAISRGYNILLEKPAAPTPQECADIALSAERAGVKAVVCHVLRYSPFFMKIKEMAESGALGTLVSIHHSECVGNLHQSHSYVRGNWGNLERSSCMLLAKSCHDIDIIQWLFGSRCTRVQSFGGLSYFRAENAPAGSAEYCIDGCRCAGECPYNAVKLYFDDKNNKWFREACTKKAEPTDADVLDAVKTTQYGKCVFKCDNDVVDHQVVNMEFEHGETASFNMSAFNKGGRYIRVMGTGGEIYGDMDKNIIEYYSFKTKERVIVDYAGDGAAYDITGGHGGGDKGLVKALYDYIANGRADVRLSEIAVSVDNHLTVFAAEESRLSNSVVDVAEFKSRYVK